MPIFVALEKETFGFISQTTNESLDTIYNIQFALIEGIGKIKINQSVENELILKAFQDYKS